MDVVMHTIYFDKSFASDRAIEQQLVATIGFFDGVHKGHQFLIDRLKETADEFKLPSAIITFSVHPREVLQSSYRPPLLLDFDEKLNKLAAAGADYCIVLDFTPELAALSAREFICDKLATILNVKVLLVGYDHKFGKDRTDGFEEYKQYGSECGMIVLQMPPLAGKNKYISSTSIRNFLKEGNVKQANEFLGYLYSLEGIVIHGDELGRTLGFPTANVDCSRAGKIIPASGVYATFIEVNGTERKGMTYIGTRPTVLPEGELRIEVNIFDFTGNLYGEKIRIRFIDRIRGDEKFTSPDSLKKQLENDREAVKRIMT